VGCWTSCCSALAWEFHLQGRARREHASMGIWWLFHASSQSSRNFLYTRFCDDECIIMSTCFECIPASHAGPTISSPAFSPRPFPPQETVTPSVNPPPPPAPPVPFTTQTTATPSQSADLEKSRISVRLDGKPLTWRTHEII